MENIRQYQMKVQLVETHYEKTLRFHLIVLISESGHLNQSFTCLGNQSEKYKMTGNKVTRQRIRSDSSVDPVDYQALEAIKIENRAKSRRKGNYIEEKQQAAVNIGKAAWDKVFTAESFDLPPTRFMEKIKAAVSEADFQDIKKGIHNTLQNEKDYLCG